MVDFVELLEANGCLNISPASHFDKMYELTDFVWKKKLSTEVSVLEYLSKNGALPIDSDHQENKQIAFDALHNIGRLFEEQMGGDTSGHRSLKALQSICARTKQYPEYQFPTVYHALLVHQNTYQYRMSPEHKVSAPKAAIEATALISNPAKWHEYVYGDKNGRIFIRNEKGTDTLPGLDHEIKSIGFSVDGNRLYVGTKKGDLFKYEYSQFHPGFEPRENILTHIKTGDGKPVYFAREWDDQYLLVSNTDQVKIFRRPNPSETNYTEIHSAPIGLSVVRRTDWSSDHKWFFATGQDATIIYQLDPEGAGIKETARITHPNITMTTLAAKIDSLGQVWLALGGEEGTVWLADGKAPALLTKGCEISDSLWFTAYSSVHESSISGLRFNPKYPQMASSDAYGFVYFWNLKYPEADYDRIRVRRRGESITSIVYVNPDELVAFESIHIWELKTNIAALQKEVDNMRK